MQPATSGRDIHSTQQIRLKTVLQGTNPATDNFTSKGPVRSLQADTISDAFNHSVRFNQWWS
jgi:hypothetical protein